MQMNSTRRAMKSFIKVGERLLLELESSLTRRILIGLMLRSYVSHFNWILMIEDLADTGRVYDERVLSSALMERSASALLGMV